jgi:hypothetical protein
MRSFSRKLKRVRLARRWVTLAAIGVIAFVGPITWLILRNAPKTEAAWFDGSWAYRQRVPLTNSSGSTQTDFQVQFTVDTATLITAGKMQSSCADVRVTNTGGKLLSYWIEPNTCNTTTTKIWAKVDSIPTATTGNTADVFLYYGNAQASSASSTAPTFIRDMAGAAATWPLDDTTATQSFSRVVNATVSAGRNIVINGTFDDTSQWTSVTGLSISGGVAHFTAGSTQSSHNAAVVISKAYTVTFTISNYSSGSFRMRLGTASGAGTSRSSNGTFTENIVAVGSTLLSMDPTSFTGDVDNITVAEINIPDNSATPTQLLTDGNMETAGTAAWTNNGPGTLSKGLTSPHGGTQTLMIARASVNSPSARQAVMTVGVPYRVYGYARSDGSATPRITDGTNVYWTGTTSTAWQPFDVVFVPVGTNVFLNDSTSTGTQYVEFDDVTVSLDTGIRSGELAQDGTMEASGTTDWLSSNAATVSKQTATPHGGTQNLRIAYGGTTNPQVSQSDLIIGRTYHISGWYRGDGTFAPRVFDTTAVFDSTGTSSTTWQFFDLTAVASVSTSFTLRCNATSAGFCEFDDISITEVSPLVGFTTNGVTLGSSTGAGGHLTNAYTFDGTNDYVNIYSGELNSAFNATEGSLIAWAKVSGSGVWTDTTTRRIALIGVDASTNLVSISRSTTNNLLNVAYVANSVSKNVAITTSSTNWMQIAVTWSRSNDQMIVYFNGAQSGSTQTGLGTWSGNLGSTNTEIGANASGLNPWSGMINDVHLYTRALTAEEIQDMYNNGTDTQTYTTSNYLGRELLRKYNASVTVGSAAAEETTPAPILFWKFDDATGTSAKDASSNKNNGTLGGTTIPTWQTETNCVSGKCLFFDGSSSKVTSSAITRGVKTVAFWINPTIVASQGLINLDGGTHKISTNASGVLTATGFSSPTYYVNGYATTTPTLIQSRWNYVEITTATAFDTTSSFTVGTDGTSFVGGYIDNVRFFNYARSATQAQADFTVGAAGISGSTIGAQQIMPNGLVANWGLQDTTSTQSYAAVTNPAVAMGSNIAINGAFDSDTIWTKGTGVTIASGVAHFDGTQLINTGVTITTLPVVSGKSYEIVYTISNYVSGQVRGLVGGNTPGTYRTANGTYTQFITAAGSASSGVIADPGFVGDIDNVSIRQVSIPASYGGTNQLLTDGNMETAGTTAWTIVNSSVLSKQTTSPHGGTQVLRVARNGVTNPYAKQTILTVGQAYRVSGYARGDGGAAVHPMVYTNSLGTALWTGSNATTSWQPFDFVFVATATDIDLVSNATSDANYVEFDDVTVTADTGIRSGELLQDIDMEASGTTYWVTTNTTVSKQTGTPHGGSQVLRVAYNGTANGWAFQGPNTSGSNQWAIGKTYRVTGWARSDGTVVPKLAFTNSGTAFWTGTSSTSWQQVDATFIMDASNVPFLLRPTMSSAGYAEYDDLSLTEVDPLVGLPTNGVTIGSAANGHLVNAYTFDGTNDNVNIYSSDLNSAFNASEGSLIAWAKVSGTGVWSDNTTRRIAYLAADGNNRVIIQKDSANLINAFYFAGGTSKTTNITTTTTGWFQVAITWSKAADQVKIFYNGAPQGTALTGLGTWAGNLASTTTILGADATTGTNPWSGMINDVQLYNRALSPAEIARLYGTAPGPVGYWPLDEGTGTTTSDISGNAFTGTLTSSPTWTTGKYGKAVNFTAGSLNYVSIPDNDKLDVAATGALTLSFWFKPPDANTGYRMIRKGAPYTAGAGSAGYSVLYRGDQANDPVTVQLNDTTSTCGTGSANFGDISNTWTHVEIIIDRDVGAVRIYKNGVFISSVSIVCTGSFANSSVLEIGSAVSGFTGPIDDVKVYNYARTPGQVVEDMNGGHPISGSPVGSQLSYWKLDEQQGQTTNNTTPGATAGTLGANSSVSTDDPTWKTSTDCKSNGCLSFDGTSDYVTVGNIATYKIASKSATFWAKPSGAISGVQGIMSLQGANWYVGFTSSNRMIASYATAAGSQQTTNSANSTVVANEWHHYGYTWEYTSPNVTVKLYKDGQLVQTGSFTTGMDTTFGSTLILGAFSTGSAWYSGNLDEVKFYSTALTDDQMRIDYNQGSALNFGTGAASESATLSDGAGNPPVGYWNFDEKYGTSANDTSGNNVAETLTNGPTWVTGKSGSAINFDGSNDYLTAANPSIDDFGTGAMTVEAWVKTSGNAGAIQEIVDNKTQGTNNAGFNLQTTVTTCLPYIRIANGTSQANSGAVNAPSICDGQWHHLAGVLTRGGSADTLSLYVDGKLKDTNAAVTQGWNITSAQALMIGAYGASAGNSNFSGSIDEVKLYNYARTAAQVAYDYNRGKPIGWWKFDECQGLTLNDASGFGSNGTWNGTAGGTQTAVGTCNTASTAWGNGTTGKFNSSLNFDGTDDYVDMGNPTVLQQTGSITISGWAKMNAGISGTSALILSKFTSATRSYRLSAPSSTGQARCDIGNTNRLTNVPSGFFTNGNWYHYVCVYNATAQTMDMYVNGQLSNGTLTNAVPSSIPNTASNNVRIGATSDAAQLSPGQIDDVRIYNYPLSASQVNQVMNEGAGARFGPSTGSP